MKPLTKEEAIALLPKHEQRIQSRFIRDGERTFRDDGWIFMEMRIRWICYIVYDDGHVSDI